MTIQAEKKSLIASKISKSLFLVKFYNQLASDSTANSLNPQNKQLSIESLAAPTIKEIIRTSKKK